MTQLALAASPLFYGGDLTMSNKEDIAFVTNPNMLECNANGVVGKCIFHARHIDIRKAPQKNNPEHGWLGIFDRRSPMGEERILRLTQNDLGFNDAFPPLFDIWENKPLTPEHGLLSLAIKSRSCVFVKY